jgi:hypothetical protein
MVKRKPSNNEKADLGSDHAPLEQAPANSNTTETKDNMAEKFLLAEFSELAQDWRHTDSRIETAINFYLTVGAVTLPGLGLLYQALPNVRLFIIVSVSVAVALFIFGFFLTRRITSADIYKCEYRLGMRMIRRYFTDHDSEISHYIYLPVASSIDSPEEIAKQRRPYFHQQLVLAINTFNSFIVGICAASLIWLVFGNILQPIGIALISLGLSVSSFMILFWLYKRKIKHSNSLVDQ